MIVGILKEIKTEENRVSMTPAGVEVMKDHGHTVLVEKNAGVGSGFEDKAYAATGAEIVKTAKEVYAQSDMVMHVKEPIYMIDGIIHYSVGNMPGAVAKTSTLALTNATLPYAMEIADKGWKKAMKENPEIKKGANVILGQITFKGVADAFGMKFTPIEKLL